MSESPAAPVCPERHKLATDVQECLMRIAQLAHATADAIATGNQQLALELDKEAETEIGRKQRALGALRQHRSDHGC